MTINFNQLIQKVKEVRVVLYSVLNGKSAISMVNYLSIYKIYIKLIITYDVSAWGLLLKEQKMEEHVEKDNWRSLLNK